MDLRDGTGFGVRYGYMFNSHLEWDVGGVYTNHDFRVSPISYVDGAGNLITVRGRLHAVIDFGQLGVGDPACDVTAAWRVLPAEVRDFFRATLSVDDATWARARGWVLSQALFALAYYTLETNAVLVSEAQRWLAEVLADEVSVIPNRPGSGPSATPD